MNTFLLSINWNPSPELFNLFGLPVRYYGLLWAVGIFLAYIIVHYQYRDKKIDGCVHLGIENTSCLSSSYIVHWHDDVIRREHFNS